MTPLPALTFAQRQWFRRGLTELEQWLLAREED